MSTGERPERADNGHADATGLNIELARVDAPDAELRVRRAFDLIVKAATSSRAEAAADDGAPTPHIEDGGRTESR